MSNIYIEDLGDGDAVAKAWKAVEPHQGCARVIASRNLNEVLFGQVSWSDPE